MTLLLKIQKKNVLFCLPFGFVYLRGCSFSAVGFVGLARFVPYICVQGDVKRDSWERRLLLRSALLQSMPKPTIKPTTTCPCSPACPGCVALCSPRDNEAGTSFLKYSLSLSGGFLTLKAKAFVDSECPNQGLAFSLTNINSPQEAPNKMGSLSRQNSTGGTATEATVTQYSRSVKPALGPSSWDRDSHSLGAVWVK